MPRIKRRTFSGCMCEQEVFTVATNRRNLKNAEPQVRFKTEEERIQHRDMQSRRHHHRVFNATFSKHSLYSTLTMNDEYEVHTFQEARHIGKLLLKRLKRANPEAQIMLYMGRGKSTHRIHFHMVSNGLKEEVILAKWNAGTIGRIETLRENNYYNGVNHGQDYKGLANYLFNHWTPEQGGHRWRQTKNVCQPERETPTRVKRTYSENKPPRAPKGYKLVECSGTGFGYQYFKYVRETTASHTKRRKC